MREKKTRKKKRLYIDKINPGTHVIHTSPSFFPKLFALSGCLPSSRKKTPWSSSPSSPFFLPAAIFLGKPLLASLFITQQVWHLWPPAWPTILTCCLHQLVSCVGKGSPHLPRVLPTAGDEKAPSQCYKILKKKT